MPADVTRTPAASMATAMAPARRSMAGLTDGRVLTCVIRSFFHSAYRVS
jgi:hypothetical protein